MKQVTDYWQIRLQVELMESPGSMYHCEQTVDMILDGLNGLQRIGARYDIAAMTRFVNNLHGRSGVYEFDIKIENGRLSEERLKEILSALPATHKIIPNVEPPPPIVVTDADRERARVFFEMVKAECPGIGGSINDECYISGTYRGKSSTSFEYSFMTHKFVRNKGYDPAGDMISNAFAKVRATME